MPLYSRLRLIQYCFLLQSLHSVRTSEGWVMLLFPSRPLNRVGAFSNGISGDRFIAAAQEGLFSLSAVVTDWVILVNFFLYLPMNVLWSCNAAVRGAESNVEIKLISTVLDRFPMLFANFVMENTRCTFFFLNLCAAVLDTPVPAWVQMTIGTRPYWGLVCMLYVSANFTGKKKLILIYTSLGPGQGKLSNTWRGQIA